MQIARVRIENFRSVRDLSVSLGKTTVFIGPNNAGKTAIVDAVRIVLTRRWGQRGTGFTENDVHRAQHDSDPRTSPAVRITLYMEELVAGEWDEDMVASLDDIITLRPDGRNVLTVRVTCAWDETKETFDPVWQFLDSNGVPLPERRRSINLSGFFGYMPMFWLGALRDANSEFAPRAGHWARLLKSIRIPDALEDEALTILADLDARIVAADPHLAEIADMIGQATRVAMGSEPGAARLNTLPLSMEDMLQRAGVVLRNEADRPWLPLGHHGQGMQSLAVIFLFQAAVLQQLAEAERTGVEAVFAIEEPEAHLHPQASRSLWARVKALNGQRLMTTHCPYFVQHVPLRDLQLVSLRGGQTSVASLPTQIVSDLPWNESVAGFVRGPGATVFFNEAGYVAAQSWFDGRLAASLQHCYRKDPEFASRKASILQLRHDCRVIPTAHDEGDLSFHGRRVRGEIFFARRWILVEGVTEYLLIQALGQAFDWTLDDHGIVVIDFKQSGGAGIYATLAAGFGIPWNMIVDGDRVGDFRDEILSRGFVAGDLAGHFGSLPVPNDLEDQLIADGHEAILRQILVKGGSKSAGTCPVEDLKARLKKRKTAYMSALAPLVATDRGLAERMPAPFVELIKNLRDGMQ